MHAPTSAPGITVACTVGHDGRGGAIPSDQLCNNDYIIVTETYRTESESYGDGLEIVKYNQHRGSGQPRVFYRIVIQ